MTKPICWMNNAIVPAHEARVSVMDHGLLYGDGVFEGIRFYARQPFRLQMHLQRLWRSAAAICLTIPYSETQLSDAIQQTIQAFALSDGYLRLVVTRGTGPMGLDPSRCIAPTVFIIADQLAMVGERVRAQGARVIIAATRRLSADGLDPRIKSLNYLNHILARMEASHAGADEAILLNSGGLVAEGTADNVFIVRDGVLITPACTDGALEGITRQEVLDIAVTLGLPYQVNSLGAYDLYTADECFLTGTGAELIPVRDIDGRQLRSCPGPIYLRIAAEFNKRVHTSTN